MPLALVIISLRFYRRQQHCKICNLLTVAIVSKLHGSQRELILNLDDVTTIWSFFKLKYGGSTASSRVSSLKDLVSFLFNSGKNLVDDQIKLKSQIYMVKNAFSKTTSIKIDNIVAFVTLSAIPSRHLMKQSPLMESFRPEIVDLLPNWYVTLFVPMPIRNSRF